MAGLDTDEGVAEVRRLLDHEWPSRTEALRSTLIEDSTWKPPIEVNYGSNGFQTVVTYTRVMVPDNFWAEADSCHWTINGVWLHPDEERGSC